MQSEGTGCHYLGSSQVLVLKSATAVSSTLVHAWGPIQTAALQLVQLLKYWRQCAVITCFTAFQLNVLLLMMKWISLVGSRIRKHSQPNTHTAHHSGMNSLNTVEQGLSIGVCQCFNEDHLEVWWPFPFHPVTLGTEEKSHWMQYSYTLSLFSRWDFCGLIPRDHSI